MPRARPSRGSAHVELVILLPIVALMLATIGYFRDAWVTVFAALHAAEHDTWQIAMSNDRGVCGSDAPHAFDGVSLGPTGDAAKAAAFASMAADSFLRVNGGVHRQAARTLPPEALVNGGWASTTRGDYLPCNETVAPDDGSLSPPVLDAIAGSVLP